MRPRKTQRNLPPCVYQKHGAYWYVKDGKWTRLAPDLPSALLRYAALAAPKDSGMASLIETAHIEIVRNVKPNTASQYDQCRRVLKDMLVDFAPDQVRGADVAQVKAAYVDRPNMGNRILSYLRLVFSYGVERGIVESNPCIGIKRHAEAKRRRYLSDAEFQAIYRAASESLQPIMMVAYLAGQRIGDILKIRLADVSADGIYFEQEKTSQNSGDGLATWARMWPTPQTRGFTNDGDLAALAKMCDSYEEMAGMAYRAADKKKTQLLADPISDGLQRLRNPIISDGTDGAYKGGKAARRASEEGRDWWTVEPGILRVANGIPNRAHRIKSLGNAQVPLQAALAWVMLGGAIDSF